MIVGLTGNIGSGKSTVSKMITDMGLTVACADKVVDGLYRSNYFVKEKIRYAFGSYVIKEQRVDRDRLRKIVLNDHEAMDILNSIVHPYVDERLENIKAHATNPLIYDSPLLMETGKYKEMDRVILVAVSEEDILVDRIKARSGLSDDEIHSILSRQMLYEEAEQYADYVILNDGSIDKLEKAVKIIMELIKNESSNISR